MIYKHAFLSRVTAYHTAFVKKEPSAAFRLPTSRVYIRTRSCTFYLT